VTQQRRRRFGVSVSESSAKLLDSLCSILGVTRSHIVEQAIEEYLERYEHLAHDHHCLGVFIVTGPVGGCGDTSTTRRVVSEYGDVVRAHLHVHDSGYCIEVLMVSGSASRIRRLYNTLRIPGRRVRFVPLDEEWSRGTSSH